MGILKFETRDFTVKSVMIEIDYTEMEERFFVDSKDGKGITVALDLNEAIGFAKAYQAYFD